MKNKENIEILSRKSVVDTYNGMRTKKQGPVSGYEAKRTLEALQAIKEHPLLIRKIREEDKKQ